MRKRANAEGGRRVGGVLEAAQGGLGHADDGGDGGGLREELEGVGACAELAGDWLAASERAHKRCQTLRVVEPRLHALRASSLRHL